MLTYSHFFNKKNIIMIYDKTLNGNWQYIIFLILIIFQNSLIIFTDTIILVML